MLWLLNYLMAAVGFLVWTSLMPSNTNKIASKTMAFANASGMLFSAIDRVGRPKVQATAMTHKTVSLVSSLNLSFNNWLLPNQLICKRTAGVGQGAKKPAIQQSARQAEEAWPHR
jgi:hypothetical protein